jgi:NadR type nicotinamide-nucleotide adenylyltransferase
MIVAFTGPESTGKTTLAEEMARHLQVPLLPEYAREYLDSSKGHYGPEDILHILHEHKKRVNQIIKEGHPLCILDTDVLVLKIWMEYKFGIKDPVLEKEWLSQPVDIYFLCTPDIPWEYDPMRENPNDRETLFTLYVEALERAQKVFYVVNGEREERFHQVKQILSSLLPVTSFEK